MRSIIIGIALALAAPATALAQDINERPSIVVVGRGSAERAPDGFTVTGSLEGRGADQITALQSLAALQPPVMERLPRMAGLDTATLTTGEVSVEPLRDPTCSDRNNQEDCAIVGYSAQVGLTLKGSPIAIAGNAVSFMAELGARDARISAFTLSDITALRDEANRAAFADARRQADLLATTSGQRIIRMLRLQDAGSRVDSFDDIIVVERLSAGRSYQAYAEIVVAPQPIRREASITVVFEIE